MLLFKCRVLGVEELPARDGFPSAAMVETWSEPTGAVKMWAPGEVGDALQELGELPEVVLSVGVRSFDVRDADKDGKRVGGFKLRALGIQSAGAK